MQVQHELQNSEAEAQGTRPPYMGTAENEPDRQVFVLIGDSIIASYQFWMGIQAFL